MPSNRNNIPNIKNLVPTDSYQIAHQNILLKLVLFYSGWILLSVNLASCSISQGGEPSEVPIHFNDILASRFFIGQIYPEQHLYLQPFVSKETANFKWPSRVTLYPLIELPPHHWGLSKSRRPIRKADHCSLYSGTPAHAPNRKKFLYPRTVFPRPQASLSPWFPH